MINGISLSLAFVIVFSCFQVAVLNDPNIEYHIITFSTDNHHESAEKLISTASKGGFTKTKHFKPSDIDDLFVERNHGILYPHWPNGPGGWIWKPYCILKYMLYVANEGDLVCYCDSRYIFTHSVIDKVQKLVESAPHIAISLHKPNEGRYKERWYSKGDAFTILNADTPENRESLQAWAGFSCYKVSFFSIQFVSQWLAYVQDIRVLYGAATITPNDAEFKDSRQDQSVLSLLAKKWKVTFFEWDSGDGLLNCRAGDCTH